MKRACPRAAGSRIMPDIFREAFTVHAKDFAGAGEASARVKSILRMIGIDPALSRRVTIAAYEAELNMVIHSFGGGMALEISPDAIVLTCSDTGPGITDVALAMREGYSTASSDILMMGFGAGMGLPNMKKNSDEFSIRSGRDGTELKMCFYIN